MLKTRFIVMSLLALTLMLTACGGGTSGLVDNDLNPGESFKAVRYNDGGSIDSALNGTIGLDTVTSGDLTYVTVSVNDSEAMWGVALDINYDAGSYSPVNVEFNGLIDTPISFSSTKVSGLIGAGQVDVNGTAVRNGEFATITFRNEPGRVVSAEGEVHPDGLDYLYEPAEATELTAGIVGYEFDAGTLTYTIRSTFAQGDGSRDGFTTAGDITPIGQYYFSDMLADADFSAAVADYDRNGLVTASDLTPLGQRYNEQITGFEFWAFDADDTTDIGTGTQLGATVAWGDGTMAARPSVGTAITDWGEVFAVWTGTFVEGDLPADTDADGFTYITCRAVNGEDQGDFVATTAVPRGTPPDPLFIINDFVFQIENATGGSAGADDLFADGDTAVIPANTEITLNVVEISGTYDGTAFTGDDGTAPSADYATQLTSFAEDVAWTAVNAGHADMEMTADVLVLDAAMGDGVTGTVFPDNDREADFEGMLDIDRAAEGTFVPAAFDWSVDIDVVIDPVVPRVVGIMTPFGVDGDGYHLVDPLVATMLTYDFDWGTNVPVDMAGVGVTLFDLTDTVEVMEFTHTTDPEPAVNEYIIRDHPDPLVAEKQLLANLAAGNMAAEHVYALRLQVNPYNSVNDPGEFLARDGYPPEVVMNTIPEPDAVLDDNDHLWIFYPEPKVRRNPRAVFNILDDTIVPEDEEAFNDIIKTTGNEFIWENAGGGVPFPKVVLVEDPDNNLNPTDIEVSTTPDPGVNQAYTCPGYIVMDIGLLTTEGGPGMDPVHYDYRVFGAGAPLGNGEFTVIKELMDPLDPVGVDFGLNIFDGDLLVATRDFSDKNLDAGTVGTTNPDVLFVEFGEGEVGAWATVQDKLTNMTFVLSGGAGDTVFNWDPRLAINDDGTMICVHTFTALDFTNAGTPGWPGHIDSPGNQTVQLADNSGSIKDTFVDPLVVTGPNPND